MKTKFFLISLIAATLCMVSCGHSISSEQEKALINMVYQSLESTPEQFAENMSKQGFRETSKSPTGISFVNSYSDYEDQVILSINYNGGKINRIIYERYMKKDSNIAASYKLFSDMIASHGFTHWEGYYKDPATGKDIADIKWENDYSSAIKAENRQDLCDHVIHEHLLEINTWQYFLEIFAYIPQYDSQWEGNIFVYTNLYFSGMSEDDSEQGCTKDIHLHFQLERQ